MVDLNQLAQEVQALDSLLKRLDQELKHPISAIVSLREVLPALSSLDETLHSFINMGQPKPSAAAKFHTGLEIMDSISDSILAIDQNWQLTYINAKAAGNWGRAPEELIGQNLWTIYPFLVGTPLETHYRQVMADRQPVQFEMKGILRDNWYLISVYPADEGILVLWLDYTIRKNTEMEIMRLLEENRRHKSLLEAVFEADPSGVAVLVGSELNFVYANPVYRFTTPDPRIDPTGKPYNEIWPTPSKYSNRERFRHVLETGRPFQVAGIEHIFPDGGRRVFSLQARRMEWDHQPAVLLILWDITEQIQAEEAIRSTALFPEQNPNPILRISLDGCLLYANSASLRLLPDFAIGKPAPRFWQQIVQEVHRSGEMRIMDFEHLGRIYSFQVVPIPETSYVNLYGGDITIRRQVETALQASEERFRLVADFTYDWEYWIGMEGKLVYNSPSCQRITGRAAHDFIDDPTLLTQIIHPLDRAHMQKHRQEELESREVHVLDFRILTPDGQVRWVGHVCQPVFGQNGRWLGTRASNRDITTRKQAEQALRYQAVLLNNLSAAVIASDKDYHITAWNPAAEAMYGWKADEVLGRSGMELVQTIFPDVEKAEMLARIAATGSYRGEAMQTRMDGSRFPVEVSSTVLREENGQISGYLSINRDITERKQAEEALRANEAKYRTTINSIGDAVITTDAQGLVTFLNPVAEKLTGWENEDALGLELEQVFPIINELTLEPAINPVGRVLQEGHVVGLANHTSLIARNGLMIPIEDSAAPIQDTQGNILGVVMVFHDVTEKRKAEAAMRENESKFMAIFQKAPLAIALSRLPNGTLVDVNEAFQQMFACSKEEAVGRTTQELGIAPDPQVRQHFLDLFKRQGFVHQQELEYRDKAGVPVTISGNIELVTIGEEKFILSTFENISERKQAEQAIQKSQEQNAFLAGVIELTSQAFGVGYPDGRLGLINHAFELLTGYSADELRSLDWVKTLTPLEWVEKEQQVLAELDRTGVPVRYQKEYIRKDGTRVPIELLVHLVKNPDGNRHFYYSFITDISQKKQVERAVEEARAAAENERNRLAAVLEALPVGVAILDGQGGILQSNRMYDEIWGKDLPETHTVDDYFAYQAWWVDTGILIQPEEWASARAVQKGETVIGQLLRIRKFDGKEAFVLNSATPIRDAEGRIISCAVAIQDISARMEAEQALRESQERLLLAAEAAEMGTWDWDLVQNALVWDQQHKALFGLAAEQPVSYETFIQLVHAEDRQRLDEAMRRAEQTHEIIDNEFRVVLPDGGVRWMHARGRFTFDPQGKAIRQVGVVLDVTPLRQIQTEIITHIGRVEVQQRLLEQREQERMQIARDLHDGPMQELLGAIYLMEGLPLSGVDSQLKESLGQVKEILTKQQAELRSYAGELRSPTLMAFGLDKAIRNHLEVWQEKYPAIAVDYRCDQEAQHLPEGKRVPLFRIFQAVMNNIIRHAQATEVSISLEKNVEGMARLTVRDNGSGFIVPRDWLALAREGHLGLVGMRERAEAAGGTLEIDSAPGMGTRIRVCVPFQ